MFAAAHFADTYVHRQEQTHKSYNRVYKYVGKFFDLCSF